LNSLTIISGIFLVALLVLYYLMKSGKFAKKTPLAESPDYPYIQEANLLTAYEQSLHNVLVGILDQRYSVFAKVGLANILSIDPELPDRALGSARERIEKETVDFVLCEKEGTAILGVIQLDPYTHQPDGRRRHETFTDMALKAAGVPVIHMPIKERYSEQELRIEITRSLVLYWDKDSGRAKQVGGGTLPEPPGRQSADQSLGECPDCGSPLQIRQARKGKFAGKHLLACSRYPACKHIRLIKEQSAILEALP
jgi:hypothetical protein